MAGPRSQRLSRVAIGFRRRACASANEHDHDGQDMRSHANPDPCPVRRVPVGAVFAAPAQAVMAVLLLVIGVVLFFQSLGDLL